MSQSPTVTQAKRFGVFSCKSEHTLLQAANRMVEESISCLIVMEARKMVGIATRTDLLQAKLDSAEWATTPVSAYMSRNVITVNAQDSIDEATKFVVANRIDRVVVVDESGYPVSVLSTSDLVYSIARLEAG